jgi:hypothetical protein
MSNKRINKAYVRFDGTGRVIAGSLILSRLKPKVGNWKEIPAYECCNPVVYTLRLLFDNLANATSLIGGDVNDVAQWNIFFDLPVNGSPFTSVTIVGNEVQLIGGSNITIRERLFSPTSPNTFLISIIDDGCIVYIKYGGFVWNTELTTVSLPNVITVEGYAFDITPKVASIYMPELITAGEEAFGSDISYPSPGSNPVLTSISFPKLETAGAYCFYGYRNVTTINLPKLKSIGQYGFSDCLGVTSISMPVCTDLGGSCFTNTGVFDSIAGQFITLTVPTALMTCNVGSPDKDIQDLQSLNTVTVITV